MFGPHHLRASGKKKVRNFAAAVDHTITTSATTVTLPAGLWSQNNCNRRERGGGNDPYACVRLRCSPCGVKNKNHLTTGDRPAAAYG